jgi:hypothetical protein
MGQFDPIIPPGVSGTRPCNVLTVAESLIATVELAAAYPMRLLQEQGLCNYRYRNVIEVTPEDLLWTDLLFVVRGVSYRTLGVVRQARVLGRFVCSYWDDDAFHIPKSSLSYKAFADAGRQKKVRLILAESNLITCSTAPLSDELFRQTGRRALQLTVPAIDPVA